MNFSLPAELLEATRLTKAGQLTEATAALQRMLGAGLPANRLALLARHGPPAIDGTVEGQEMGQLKLAPPGNKTFSHGLEDPVFRIKNKLIKPVLANSLCGFIDRTAHGGFHLPGGLAHRAPTPIPADLPNGAEFLACTFSNQAGSRPYKLYVPSGYHGQSVPLIVMLHGCTQSPDDFAAGTRMNAAAEEHTCLVAYPGQTSSANMQKCWNWFSAADQQRDVRRALAHRGNYARSDARLRHRPAMRLHCGAFGGRRCGSHHGRCLPRSVRRDRRAFRACLWCRARHALCIRGDAGQRRSGAETRTHDARGIEAASCPGNRLPW